MLLKLFSVFIAVSICTTIEISAKVVKTFHTHKVHVDSCDRVCIDLPQDDMEPVCMMFSRYKRGYQHFVNLCHARRAICYDNLVLHMVHPSRCMKSGQYYMPVN